MVGQQPLKLLHTRQAQGDPGPGTAEAHNAMFEDPAPLPSLPPHLDPGRGKYPAGRYAEPPPSLRPVGTGKSKKAPTQQQATPVLPRPSQAPPTTTAQPEYQQAAGGSGEELASAQEGHWFTRRGEMVFLMDRYPLELAQMALDMVPDGSLTNMAASLRPTIPIVPSAPTPGLGWAGHLAEEEVLVDAMLQQGLDMQELGAMMDAISSLLLNQLQSRVEAAERVRPGGLDYSDPAHRLALVASVRRTLQLTAREGQTASTQPQSDRGQLSWAQRAQEAARQAQQEREQQADARAEQLLAQEQARKAELQRQAEAERLAEQQRAAKAELKAKLEAELQAVRHKLQALQDDSPAARVVLTQEEMPEQLRQETVFPGQAAQTSTAAPQSAGAEAEQARVVRVLPAGGNPAGPPDPESPSSSSDIEPAELVSQRAPRGSRAVRYGEWRGVQGNGDQDIIFHAVKTANLKTDRVAVFTKRGARDPSRHLTTEVVAPRTAKLPTGKHSEERNRGSDEAKQWLREVREYLRNWEFVGPTGNRFVPETGIPPSCIDRLLPLFQKWAVSQIKSAGWFVCKERAEALHPQMPEERLQPWEYLTFDEVMDILTAGGEREARKALERRLRDLRYRSSDSWAVNFAEFNTLASNLGYGSHRAYNQFHDFVADDDMLRRALFGDPGNVKRPAELEPDDPEADERWAELLRAGEQWQADLDAALRRKQDRDAARRQDARTAPTTRPMADRPTKRSADEQPRSETPPIPQPKKPKQAPANELKLVQGRDFAETVALNPNRIPRLDPSRPHKIPKFFTAQCRKAGKCQYCLEDFHGTQHGSCDASDDVKAASLRAYKIKQDLDKQKDLERKAALDVDATQRAGARPADRGPAGGSRDPSSTNRSDDDTGSGRAAPLRGGRSTHPAAGNRAWGDKERSRSPQQRRGGGGGGRGGKGRGPGRKD